MYSVVADNDDEFWLASRHLWKWNRDAVSVDGNVKPEPVTINAFPNPFNPSTTITFNLPQPADVTLTVYAITGQKVATLAEGWLNAGTHMALFDGAHLASGIYIYRLESGNVVRSGKMLLMK